MGLIENLILLISFLFISSPLPSENVNKKEFLSAFHTQKNKMVIDIRSFENYSKSHIEGSINMPFSLNLDKKIKFFEPKHTIFIVGDHPDSCIKASEIVKKTISNKVLYLTESFLNFKSEEIKLENFEDNPEIKKSFNNFNINAKSAEKVYFMFGATWCPPCQGLKKEISKIKTEEIDFKIILIDIDQEKPLTQSQGIEGYPTSIVFKNGVEIWRKKGFMTKSELLKSVKEL